MALKVNDLIATDVWQIIGFDLETNKPLFSLKDCNNAEFTHSKPKVEVTSRRGTIAIIGGEGKFSLNVSSATLDLNLLGLQAGDGEGIIGTNVEVPAMESAIIGTDATPTVSLKGTPTTDCIISVMLDDGSTTLVEGETVGVGKFTVSENVLTFDNSVAGKSCVVFYDKLVTEAVDIIIDNASEIKNVMIKAVVSFKDVCSNLSYLGWVLMNKAAISKDFVLSASKSPSGDGADHSATFDSLATCGDTILGRIFIYDENAVE